MSKRDPLLSYIVIVLDKLGGEITITQEDIKKASNKNLEVVIGERGAWHKLSTFDYRKTVAKIHPFEQR